MVVPSHCGAEGVQMSTFTVELDNKRGLLFRLCEAMASGVNFVLWARTDDGSSRH